MDRHRFRIPALLLTAALAVGAAGCAGHRTSRRIDLVPRHRQARQGAMDGRRQPGASTEPGGIRRSQPKSTGRNAGGGNAARPGTP